MAAVGSQASQFDDAKARHRSYPEPVPTPLRRRSVSPARELGSLGSVNVEQKAPAAVGAPGATAPAAHGRRGLGLMAGVAMLAFACLRPIQWTWPKSNVGSARQVPSVATVDPQPEEGPRLPALIRQALDCHALKADLLDVVAGAPYEFSVMGEDHEGFFHLPRLAAAAQNLQKVDDLRKAVLQIAATGGGWHLQLQKRLLQLLQTPCEARSCLFAAAPLSPEVDEGFTSPRALSGGWLHQAFLTMGSITGIPSFRARAELYRSQPPSVILSNASITQMRDCFAFRGSKEHPPALALRLRSPSVVTQLIIEQPPRWAALRPDSLPRRFRVYGATEATSQAYTENLGDFVYAAAGPAVQAFHLANASGARLTGLRMVFEGPESDKHYICLYRLKLFEGPETACSNGRAAWRLQTNSD